MVYRNLAGLRGAGMIAYSCSPAINNNTVSENRLVGGVYGPSRGGGLWAASASSFSGVNNIVYSNYSQENPECYGDVNLTYSCVSTALTGVGNITGNPLFVNPAVNDFNLQAGSPCIDAGDPGSPLDPDSTRADMGALYFDQNRLYVTLTPANPPILIPAGGGSFGYEAAVSNNSLSPAVADVWTEVRFPNGISFPLLRRLGVTIPMGAVLSRQLTQNVPGSIPPGTYTYFAKAGAFPDVVMAFDSFDFEKSALDNASGGNERSGWEVYGWEETELPESLPHIERMVEISASPNPFNASTAIGLHLAAPCYVKLSVYDVAGREAARLVEGFYPAGTHRWEWDASAMPSGVYFTMIEAEGAVQVKKIILMK